MAGLRQDPIFERLRARVRQIERGARVRHAAALPFGVPALDSRLPEDGLSLGALHEIAGAGAGAVHGTAAVLFAGGILARLAGPVLWCLKSRDLFAPALAGVGLHPDRVVYVAAGDERTVLLAVEEGLRHGGLAGVVGETARLPMTASRRLQLAAESSGTVALVIRRWHRAADAAGFAAPSAAVSRWRVAALPATSLPAPGIGRPRWRVELVRCRGVEGAAWEVEACDAQGRLALPADMADRPAASAGGRRRAARG